MVVPGALTTVCVQAGNVTDGGQMTAAHGAGFESQDSHDLASTLILARAVECSR